MIRVVHILTRPNIGGPSVIVVSLFENLDPELFSQTLMFGSVGQLEGDFLKDKNLGLQIIEIPGLGRRVKIFDDLKALIFIVKNLQKLKPHIVHTHMAKAGALGRLSAALVGVPIRIHTYHGHLLSGYFRSSLTRLLVLAERSLAKLTTFSIVVGEQVRQDLIEHKICSAEKSISISPGIKPIIRLEKSSSRSQLGLPLDRPIIMFVGRLARIKRPDIFVGLARRFENHPLRPIFAFVGDGPLADQLKQESAHLDNVVFSGWHQDLDVVYSAADIVVLCSDNEGMPLSLIEASSIGVPIIASNVGSVCEIVTDEENGLLVEAGNIDSFYSNTMRLLENPSLRQKMSESKHKSRTDFTFKQSASNHAAIYQKLFLENCG